MQFSTISTLPTITTKYLQIDNFPFEIKPKLVLIPVVVVYSKCVSRIYLLFMNSQWV